MPPSMIMPCSGLIRNVTATNTIPIRTPRTSTSRQVGERAARNPCSIGGQSGVRHAPRGGRARLLPGFQFADALQVLAHRSVRLVEALLLLGHRLGLDRDPDLLEGLAGLLVRQR